MTLPHAKKYYMTVTPLFAVGCLLGLPTYLALVLVRYGLHVNWFAFTVGAAGGSVAGLIATIVVVRLFPTAITEEGVYGYSALGQRRFIGWQEVGQVRPEDRVVLFNTGAGVKYLEAFGQETARDELPQAV